MNVRQYYIYIERYSLAITRQFPRNERENEVVFKGALSKVG